MPNIEGKNTDGEIIYYLITAVSPPLAWISSALSYCANNEKSL